MIRPSVTFPLGEVITGEPHLYRPQGLAVRQHLSRLEREPRDLHLMTSVALHLPRIILIGWGAAGILLWLAGMATAAGPAVDRITPACVDRDLNSGALFEQRGAAQHLPTTVRGATGHCSR